jgi:hypothetical protein
VGRYGLDSSDSGWEPVACSCELGNELSGSIKSGKFLDQMSEYKLFKKDSSSWS